MVEVASRTEAPYIDKRGASETSKDAGEDTEAEAEVFLAGLERAPGQH